MCVTAGSRLRMYGGAGGLRECKYELILWTKVDFPAPAIPIVMMATGFFLGAASMTNTTKSQAKDDLHTWLDQNRSRNGLYDLDRRGRLENCTVYDLPCSLQESSVCTRPHLIPFHAPVDTGIPGGATFETRWMLLITTVRLRTNRFTSTEPDSSQEFLGLFKTELFQ